MPEDTPAANLLLGVLRKLDVPLESFADSTGSGRDLSVTIRTAGLRGAAACRVRRARRRRVPLAPRADEVPSSPLAEAAQRGDAAAVRALLEAGDVDVDAPSRDGTPALHWAVRVGDRETAERLIAAGADVERRESLRRAAAALSRSQPATRR